MNPQTVETNWSHNMGSIGQLSRNTIEKSRFTQQIKTRDLEELFVFQWPFRNFT